MLRGNNFIFSSLWTNKIQIIFNFFIKCWLPSCFKRESGLFLSKSNKLPTPTPTTWYPACISSSLMLKIRWGKGNSLRSAAYSKIKHFVYRFFALCWMYVLTNVLYGSQGNQTEEVAISTQTNNTPIRNTMPTHATLKGGSDIPGLKNKK